ncbi:MAG TPA: PmoA family protein [Phnomibacter sp.]|nr:PmoA family protein [Phnomibacter sp.]
MKYFHLVILTFLAQAIAAQSEKVKIKQGLNDKKVEVFIGATRFTSFLYPDSLEKPVLYPLTTSAGTIVTRGFPLEPFPGDPIDHPHHIGLWFNFENVNGLDFWNNSYAIAAEKKKNYGWVKTDRITQTSNGKKGILAYHANWTNQQKQILLEEKTRLEFSGTAHTRMIDRTTTLTANTDIVFTDAKDGLLAIRLAHALQIPTKEDQKFTDNKGRQYIVKGGTDTIPTGSYLTSAGMQGNAAWGTQGRWCKAFGKMGNDSVSVIIIDHPSNYGYPNYWHARGYGLFAANPFGNKIFTNGKSESKLALPEGQSLTFRYRVIIDNAASTLSAAEIDALADAFGKQ